MNRLFRPLLPALLAAAIGAGGCAQKVGIEIGEMAPDVRLQTLDAKPVDLSSFRGKPVLIDFWATWCGPCRQSLPVIQGMHELYGPKGLKVLAVTSEDGPDKVRAFAKELKLDLPWYLDRTGIVASKLGVAGLPTTILIDKEGKIVMRKSGVSVESLQELNRVVQEQL